MVAGGTGLAPLRAVLQQIERRWRATGYGPRVHLFHGSRMPWNLYDHEYLSELAQKQWFDYTPVVSEDPRTTAPKDSSAQWQRNPATGRTGPPCCAARRTWSGIRRRSLRPRAFPPRRLGREQFDFQGAASPTEELHDAMETR